MGITVIVAFTVKDPEEWNRVFTAAEGARAEAGINAKAYRPLDGTNRVYVIGTAPSEDAFTTFFKSPEQAERLKQAGVIAPPEKTMLQAL